MNPTYTQYTNIENKISEKMKTNIFDIWNNVCEFVKSDLRFSMGVIKNIQYRSIHGNY